MLLVVAEKPSVGVALAKALGVTEKKDGYIEGNGYIVSWCVGHPGQPHENKIKIC